ncbi:MAG: hypothetical protein JWM78_3527 [Verrucomicrobiaceae bacterium]|nr:hypothetical protein [Verrucomicrobiaceae bacterium]
MTVERRDYVALEWVAGEISETLAQSAAALDAYLQNRDDTTRLRFCLTYVHQVYGTLKMVEFAGAALLAEEMEEVVEALLSHKISDVQQDDALHALQAALAQLPGYLKQLLVQRRDAPALLLPMINDLRAVRGEMLITESAVFVPELSAHALSSPVAPAMASAELLDVARKLRQMYQMALLNYLRNNDPRENLNYLAKVCSRLSKLAAGKPPEALWKICIALLEGLLNRSIQPNAAVKTLLRQVDSQLKLLAEQGAAALELEPPRGLIKNLLYYVAASSANSRYISEIKEAYNLTQSLPAAAEFADDEVAQSIKAALAQQLIALAHDLAQGNAPTLLLAAVKRAQDTTALLGMSAAQGNLRELAQQLQFGAVDIDRIVPMLRQLADGLELAQRPSAPRPLFNDSEEAQEQLDKAFDAVMRESRNSLEQAKEAIIEFVATQWRHSCLEEVPELLSGVRGSFAVAGLHRAADVLAACETFVRYELIEQRKIPAWQLLDTLADAIASVDYYLERLSEDAEAECESILSVAEQSIAVLALASESALIVSTDSFASSAQVLPFQRPERAAEELIDDNSPLHDDELHGQVQDQGPEPAAEAAEIAFAAMAESFSNSSADNFSADHVSNGDLSADDDVADAEIIEIFIEEAGEVLDTIALQLPLWSAAPDDIEILSVIRRAFHTLKGSGRMVGAIDIGELAWSVENMLNRVMDGTLRVDNARIAVVIDAAALVPAMVEAFRLRLPCDTVAAQEVSDRAFVLSREQTPFAAQTTTSQTDALQTSAPQIDWAPDSEFAPSPAAVFEPPLLADLVEPSGNSEADEIEADGAEQSVAREFSAEDLSTDEPIADTFETNELLAEAPAFEELALKELARDDLAEDVDDRDTTLLDIFAAEALTHLQTVEDFIQRAEQLAGPAELSDDLQRALHTLKGSAHMADVQAVANLVSPVEHLIKELRTAQMKADADIMAVLTEGVDLFRAGLAQVATDPHQPVPGTDDFVDWVNALYHTKLDHIEEPLNSPEDSISPVAFNHFLGDSIELISAVSDDLILWQEHRLDDERQHTLAATISQVADSAELLNLAPVVDLSQALQALLRQGAEAAPLDERFFALASEAADTLIDMLDRLAANQLPDSPAQLVAALQDFEFYPAPVALDVPMLDDIVDVGAELEAGEPVEAWLDSQLEEQAHTHVPSLLEFEMIPADWLVDPTAVITDVEAEDTAAHAALNSDTSDTDVAAQADAGANELDAPPAVEPPTVLAGIEETSVETEALLAADTDTDSAAAELLELVGSDSDDIVIELDDLAALDTAFVDGAISEPEADLANEEPEIVFEPGFAEIAAEVPFTAQGEAETGVTAEADTLDEIEPLDIAAEDAGAPGEAWRDAPVYEIQIEESAAGEPELIIAGPEHAAPTFEQPAFELPVFQPAPWAPEPLSAFDAQAAEDEEIDTEILEIFLEEAVDLLEAIDQAVHGWSDDRANPAYLDDLQRFLHTLKGGARLAGLKNLGNLSHNFETLLINAQQQGRDIDDPLLQEVHSYQDQLVRLVDAVKLDGRDADDLLSAPAPEPELDAPAEFIARDEAEHNSQHNAVSSMLAELLPEGDSADEADFDEARVLPFARPQAEPKSGTFQALIPREIEDLPELGGIAHQLRRGPQEVVKISAQLIEQLVNLAGETSIARSRSEEQVNEFVFSLDEMQITVDRLHEQVRRLDLETEAQMLFRQEQVESEGMEGFDPLEFDRYSLLQQLSRSLLESASDLVDIKSTLSEKARDMETLLVQQSRINSELQEGLMRSRMVPFARMVPRLRRIVRQVAGELDKQVDFFVDNAEGELDRTVLERVVAPLEHMLRNAIDHGIEAVSTRLDAGKPPQGTIVLSLSREGSEIVLTLSDDGHGIDLEAVRAKAIDREMMAANASLSDHEVMQFILQPGFSTAKQVTQISGRGVGMDVVYSEIKQLGGTLDIDSAWGQGTQFTVRLPFTVSVNRALMVSVAGDMYAIPLNSIEGIVRVSPFELEAYYQPDAPLFEYAGQPYLMRYMGALLRTGDKPNLEGLTMPLPVLLVRGSDHSVAVQVDGLMGSREIVVKTLGPQFGLVQGLSGATVLGDGSVVVILDLLAMIRADALHLHRDLLLGQEESSPERSRPLLVMVVDDSVTVRKVTSRFLERQGMEVMLAKDGVDAINLLQESEQVPDVMLLDIEMPRMDGFEVASRVRHTSRLQNMPIIMITSRTGEKHRERAFSLGVNRYLGKPYQEMALLDTIYELTGSMAQL